MKRTYPSSSNKVPAYPKKTKQETAKPKIKLGKESFENLSPLARDVETRGVNKVQKKELEHNQGPKKSKNKSKLKDMKVSHPKVSGGTEFHGKKSKARRMEK